MWRHDLGFPAERIRAIVVGEKLAASLAEVFEEFFPDVRPPRCVSKIGVDRPGLLVSIAMVAIKD